MNFDLLIKKCEERIKQLQMTACLTDDYIDNKIINSQIELLTNLIEDLKAS